KVLGTCGGEKCSRQKNLHQINIIIIMQAGVLRNAVLMLHVPQDPYSVLEMFWKIGLGTIRSHFSPNF
ncbi:hypothetical protein AGIG_G26591, partial [Arapaima gigas]